MKLAKLDSRYADILMETVEEHMDKKSAQGYYGKLGTKESTVKIAEDYAKYYAILTELENKYGNKDFPDLIKYSKEELNKILESELEVSYAVE